MVEDCNVAIDWYAVHPEAVKVLFSTMKMAHDAGTVTIFLKHFFEDFNVIFFFRIDLGILSGYIPVSAYHFTF